MSYEMQLIAKLQSDLQNLQQRFDNELAALRGEVRTKIREHEATLTALLDVLTDGGQLDRGELDARVRAAAIEHTHDEITTARTSQDVWDSLKSKP